MGRRLRQVHENRPPSNGRVGPVTGTAVAGADAGWAMDGLAGATSPASVGQRFEPTQTLRVAGHCKLRAMADFCEPALEPTPDPLRARLDSAPDLR